MAVCGVGCWSQTTPPAARLKPPPHASSPSHCSPRRARPKSNRRLVTNWFCPPSSTPAGSRPGGKLIRTAVLPWPKPATPPAQSANHTKRPHARQATFWPDRIPPLVQSRCTALAARQRLAMSGEPTRLGVASQAVGCGPRSAWCHSRPGKNPPWAGAGHAAGWANAGSTTHTAIHRGNRCAREYPPSRESMRFSTNWGRHRHARIDRATHGPRLCVRPIGGCRV